MKIFALTSVAALVATAGLAAAQPIVDGVIDAADALLYTTNYIQTVPTGFGDSPTGSFRAGGAGGTIVLGFPELVTTGVEIAIPKTALGGATAFDFFAIVNNGGRDFPSNQMVHAGDLIQNEQNVGGTTGWPSHPNYGIDVSGTQFITVASIPVVADGSIIIDGQSDAGYGMMFIQNNYTGFGDATCGTIAPGCGGNEIDNLSMAQDTTNIYIHIAGNLETNGNSVDMWFDTGVGGQNTLLGGATDSGNGVAFAINNQATNVFEPGFDADYFVSVDYSFGVLRALYSDIAAGTVQLAGEGLAADTTVGGAVVNAEIAGFLLTQDNSNIDGVPGTAIGTVLPNEPDSPMAPDAVWSYGSELDNVRSYIDVANNKLYVFLGGNLGIIDRNRFMMFFDVQAGGQNTIGINPNTLAAVTNQDISFSSLRAGKLEGSTFDAGFNADYFVNFSYSLQGARGNTDPTENYTDIGILRTDGMLIDPFFAVPSDWSAFHGNTPAPFLMDFPGTYADPADGRDFLGTDGGPRLATNAFGIPVGGVITAAASNLNDGGVTDLAADCALAAAVTSGYEFCISLDELGWDGVQDILMVAAVTNENFTWMSNQLAGDTSAITANLGATPFDLTAVPGNQYVNLMTDTATCAAPCPADMNGDGLLDNGDIGVFVGFFLTGNLAADMNGDGLLDNGDIGMFVSLFLAGCP